MPVCGMAATWHRAIVGSRLRVAIEATGRPQAEIARQFEISPSKLGNWLRGDNYPDELFLSRFCDRYNISMDYIYRGRVAAAMAGPVADALYAAEQALQSDHPAAVHPEPSGEH